MVILPRCAYVWDTVSMPNAGGCQFLEIPIDLDSNIVAMAWNPRLPHRHLLDHFLRKMKESGQLNRIFTKWIPDNKADCWGAGEFRYSLIKLQIQTFHRPKK